MFEQERTLSRLQQRVSSEAGLLAAFLSGSFGRRDADPYADVDVVLVYPSQAAKELARPNRESFAAEILPYVRAVVYQPPENPDHLVALYANGSKFDFSFLAQDEVQPHPAYQTIRILKDTGGWADNLMSRSAGISEIHSATLSEKRMAQLDRRFWADFWEVYRLTRRGEVDRPFPVFVRLLADILPPLLENLPPELPIAQQLTQINFSRQADHNLETLKLLVVNYREARDAVVQRLRLSFQPHSAVENELMRLINR
ncbi:MAG: nucleotidyltransferase domain-containing protein [Ardenticatenaceae bacterium]|nr:nucleotidyltransferase domain-containing protein [Ardenticatenaceae bacterium]